MSNTEGGLKRSARRHRAAIWGIVIALVAAGLALVVFGPWNGRQETVTPVPATATSGGGAAVPAPGAADPAATAPKTN